MKLHILSFFCLLNLFSKNIQAQKDTLSINKTLKIAKQLRITHPKKADSLNKKIIEYSKQIDYQAGEYEANVELMTIESTASEYDMAIEYCRNAFTIAKKMNSEKRIIHSQINLGKLLIDKGDFKKATKIYLETLPLSIKAQDTLGVITINQNLALIFSNLEQYSKAIEYTIEALKFSMQSKNTEKSVENGLNLGLLYTVVKEPKKAYDRFIEIEPLVKEMGDTRYSYHLNKNLAGYFNEHTNDLAQALKYAQNSYDLINKTSSKYEISFCSNLLGDIYLKKSDVKNAEKYNLNAYSISKEIDAKFLERKIVYSLSKIYAFKKSFKDAYFYANSFNLMNDSLVKEDNNKVINTLTTKFETEKKDKEIASQKLQLQEQNNDILKKKNQFNLAISGGAFLFFLGIGIWFFFKQRHKLKNNEILALKGQQEVIKLESLIDGEEKERNRLAQDLHDGINGDLAVIKYKISSIESSKFTSKEKSFYNDAIDMLDNAVDQVRRISHNLAPPSLQNFDLIEAIQQFCSKQNASNSVNISYQYFGNRLNLKKENETAIYRIIQELLNNIIKHANATEALVQLNNHGDKLNITVEDNGLGFDHNSSTNGIGLQNIKSRVNFLKAKLDINSSQKGTTFSIEIDVTKNDLI